MPRAPMKNVTPGGGPSASWLKRRLPWVLTAIVALALCLVFPRMLAFVELAARELRYLWWLVLMVALAVYFFFFFGRKKD